MKATNSTPEQRSCTSKKKYGTRELALAVAASATKNLGTSLRVYGPCRFCSFFHLTSSRGPRPARVRPKHRKTIAPKFDLTSEVTDAENEADE